MKNQKLSKKELELLSEEIHKIYCEQYFKVNKKPYWTKKDYSKLNEETKEYDRVIARFIFEIIKESNKLQRILCKESYNEFTNRWEIGVSDEIENALSPDVNEILNQII